MTLESFIGEIAQYDSFLFNKSGVAGWGLLIVAVTVLILLLWIAKRKRKAKDVSILIYHNRQQELLRKNSNQWEKGKNRIEKLLYEITEHAQPGECLNPQPDLSNNNKRRYCDIPIYGRTNQMLRERNAKVSKSKDSSTPLDVQELQAVATLAKHLRARSRHSVRT